MSWAMGTALMAMADGGEKDEEHANDEGGVDEGNDDGDGGGGGDH